MEVEQEVILSPQVVVQEPDYMEIKREEKIIYNEILEILEILVGGSSSFPKCFDCFLYG